jgi:hypothetical protein
MTLRALLVALIAAALSAIAPSAGHAEPGNPVSSLDAQMLNGDGDPENGAGAHPDRLAMKFLFDLAAGNLKDLQFELPPGFIGDSNAVPTCPRNLISLYTFDTCPTASQIGTVEVDALGFPTVAALFNLDPEPGYIAEFGFKTFVLDSRLFVKMLPNGQARFEMHDAVQDTALSNLKVDVWGVPADHQTAPTAPRRAFLGMATRCDGLPPALTLRARTWQDPETWHVMTGSVAPPLVGCDGLELQPQLGFSLGDATTDSPTGAQITVDVPQELDVEDEPTARVKDMQIRFPEGVALSPGAANGLTACSEEAARLGQPGPSACPASSKVGAAEMTSPLLKAPVEGTVHIGRQLSATDYRIYVVLNDGAIDIELAGTLHADPETGDLSAEMLDVPELVFERLTLSFSGGPRALLVTPQECGSGTASIALASYSGGSPATAATGMMTSGDPFGRPCPSRLPFAPGFVAGTSHPRAGAAAPLAVTVRRVSGEQLLDRFAMTLPPGLSARLASVPRCKAAAAAGGACPRATRIGTAITETGSGPSPYTLAGDAFLTGPYRDAPFGMALVFRAIAGPFDLGTVVIRSTLRIDPRSGQVTVETDRLPRIVNGVPLRIQTVALDIDRPGFLTNPTSCAPTSVAARLDSVGGAVARLESRFAVGGCRSLRFRPKVSMTLVDRPELRVDGHPGLRMKLSSSTRGANLRDLSFELPALLKPSVTGPTAICSRTQLADERCPAASAVGKVSARTPVLSKPLRGAIYSVQPPGGGIPDVWAVMRSTGVSVRFRMRNELEGGRLRGQLVGLPDIPLAGIAMTFASGKRGMFSLDRVPCVGGRARRMTTQTRLTAHSGAARRAAVPVRVGPGCAARSSSGRR